MKNNPSLSSILLDLISITLDDGAVHLYDPRVGLREASMIFTVPKKGLYAHEFYGLFDVLLGFGSGELAHLDVRNRGSRVVDCVKDPYVDTIGGIVYNHQVFQVHVHDRPFTLSRPLAYP